ncbi:hypothetical protein KC330_g1591 [Hortaea werneckii]|nr:hypothetical protein KC330_g1591 [Hortaea werneckii]
MPGPLLARPMSNAWQPAGVFKEADDAVVTGNILWLHGAMVDTIAEVAHPFSDIGHGRTWPSILRFADTFADRGLSTADFMGMLRRTLTTDSASDDHEPILQAAFTPWLALQLVADSVHLSDLWKVFYIRVVQLSSLGGVLSSIGDVFGIITTPAGPELDTIRTQRAMFEAQAKSVTDTRRLFVTARCGLDQRIPSALLYLSCKPAD